MSSAVRIDRETLLKLAAEARAIANPPGQIPPGALGVNVHHASRAAG